MVKKQSYASLDRQARHMEKQVKQAKTPAEKERTGRLLGGILKKKRQLSKGK